MQYLTVNKRDVKNIWK